MNMIIHKAEMFPAVKIPIGSKGMKAAEFEIKRLKALCDTRLCEINSLGDIVEQGLCRYNCRRRADIWKDGFNFSEMVSGYTADEAYKIWKEDNE